MSQVTPALDVVEISSIWSQVTPQAESIEMVQYVISKPILNEILIDSNRVHDVFLSRDIVQTRRFSSEGIYRRVIRRTALHL